ncbi:hypothetical protein V8G54_035186 [Vigna mungo]|uniref:Uncharacterized protein n=1 Tax=Vigna mungo TaxID=3915 RepID=A0AAQ3MER6_VIGMU
MNIDTQTGDEEGLVHVAMFAGAESIGQTEALKKSVWKDAMREEVDFVRKNGIWKLVDIPPGKKKSIEGNVVKEEWGVTGEPRHGEHKNTQPQHSFNRAGRRLGASNWQPHSHSSLSRSFAPFGLGCKASANWHSSSPRDWQGQLLNGLASASSKSHRSHRLLTYPSVTHHLSHRSAQR